jgi:hypothetical protein
MYTHFPAKFNLPDSHCSVRPARRRCRCIKCWLDLLGPGVSLYLILSHHPAFCSFLNSLTPPFQYLLKALGTSIHVSWHVLPFLPFQYHTAWSHWSARVQGRPPLPLASQPQSLSVPMARICLAVVSSEFIVVKDYMCRVRLLRKPRH